MRYTFLSIFFLSSIFSISDVINEVFGVTLLLNFLSSSVLVCFVGFQMTLDQSPEIVCKLAVYLVAATVEIYLLCFFSDWLISAVSWGLYHSLDLRLPNPFAQPYTE